jgi:hypothetical protein
MSTKTLLSAKLTTGSGSWISVSKNVFSVTCALSDTTTPAATVHVEWSPDAGTTVHQIGNFTMSGAADEALATFDMAPGDIRLTVHAITGTSASVSGKVRY